MRSSRLPGLIVALTTAHVVSACGEFKKLDEMKDNTSEMNNTTKTLAKETGDANKKMDEMKTLTERIVKVSEESLAPTTGKVSQSSIEIYDSGRQGTSAQLRREALDHLLVARSMQNRLAEATLYVSSFEHQLIGETGRDPLPEQRLLFYQQTLSEFLTRLDEFAPRGRKVWPDAKPDIGRRTSPSEENRAAAFNALAYSISKNNRKQSVDPEFGKEMSIYDLIIHALKLKPAIDDGRFTLPAGPHFVKEVLARPELINQLLQTRYSMYVYALLATMTDFTELPLPLQLIRLLSGIEIDYSERKLGVAGQAFVREEILIPAVTTAADMKAIGLKPVMTGKTGLVVSRIDFKPSESVAELINNDAITRDLIETYLDAAK